MTNVWRWGWCGVVVVAAFGAAPAEGAGQEQVLPPPALILFGGGFSYDHGEGDTGTGTVMGIRMDFPLSEIFTLEPGVDRMSWDPQAENAETQSLWTVDFAVHGEYVLGQFVPYVGVNLGAALNFAEERRLDEAFIDASYGGHGGLRFDITERLGVRGEVRGRWVDNFDSILLLYTGGLSWRF